MALFREQNAYMCSIEPQRVALTDDVLTATELEKLIADESTRLTVAEADGRLAALLLAAHYVANEDRWLPAINVVYVREMIVAEDFRRRGVGSQLIDDVMAWARGKGATRIDLHAWNSNEQAREFYQALGFRPVQHLLSLDVVD